MPERYRGVVVREGEEGEERIEGGGAVGGRREGGGGMEEGDEGMEEDEEEEEEEVKVLDEVARFEELVVWGHESVPEEDNVFVKGVEEWIKFAEAVSFFFFFSFSSLVCLGAEDYIHNPLDLLTFVPH